MKPNKFEKICCFLLVKMVCNFSPRWATRIQEYYFKKWGIRFHDKPNYISSKVWMDGTDYSLIFIGKEVTISSYVRLLTHDWVLHTIAKSLDIKQDRLLGVEIGDYSFIGSGTIIMPGSKIGKSCIIGAGTVVRGVVPDNSIYIVSPVPVVGDSVQYLERLLEK